MSISRAYFCFMAGFTNNMWPHTLRPGLCTISLTVQVSLISSWPQAFTDSLSPLGISPHCSLFFPCRKACQSWLSRLGCEYHSILLSEWLRCRSNLSTCPRGRVVGRTFNSDLGFPEPMQSHCRLLIRRWAWAGRWTVSKIACPQFGSCSLRLQSIIIIHEYWSTVQLGPPHFFFHTFIIAGITVWWFYSLCFCVFPAGLLMFLRKRNFSPSFYPQLLEQCSHLRGAQWKCMDGIKTSLIRLDRINKISSNY